jgi:hypothetical protein
MSVKRLKLVEQFHSVVSKRLRDLFKDFDHAKRESYKDIISHLDYSHRITKELLERAKKYQKRDAEVKKK